MSPPIMRYVSSLPFLALAFLLLSSCASSDVQDKKRYFGCYELNGRPALMIETHRVSDMSGNENELLGFTKLRDSDFLQVRNRMLVDKFGKFVFAPEASGYQYEFKRTRNNTLIIYDERGRQFDLVKSGPECP